MSRWVMGAVCAAALVAFAATPAQAEEAKKISLTPIVVAAPAEAEFEARIRKVLDEKTSFDFVELPLSQVVAFLKDKHKLDVQLDLKALEDATIGLETPVTRSVHDVTLRSALRLTLGAIDLTYITGNEVLLITTPDRANSELRTVIYPVSDLTAPTNGKIGGEDYRSLIDLITTTVYPTTWDEVGGPGSIRELRKSRSLVISQTEEVHEEIPKLLTALRAARDSQPELPKITALESIADSLWTIAHPTVGTQGFLERRAARRAGRNADQAAEAGVGGGMGGMGGGMGGGVGGGVGGGMF